jgi:hypothetical protein
VTNTLVSAADLATFGPLDDAMVDAAAADMRRDAGWHIAPRLTETIAVECYGGPDLILPTRSFPEAPVVVTGVAGVAGELTNWQLLPGATLRRGVWRGHYGGSSGWPFGYLSVTLTHGFTQCPPDLLPVIAQRAQAATQMRDSRVTSFSNGAIQMAFGDAFQLNPALAKYAVFAGVS